MAHCVQTAWLHVEIDYDDRKFRNGYLIRCQERWWPFVIFTCGHTETVVCNAPFLSYAYGRASHRCHDCKAASHEV